MPELRSYVHDVSNESPSFKFETTYYNVRQLLRTNLLPVTDGRLLEICVCELFRVRESTPGLVNCQWGINKITDSDLEDIFVLFQTLSVPAS